MACIEMDRPASGWIGPPHVVPTSQTAQTARMTPTLRMARLDLLSASRAKQIKRFRIKRPASGWIGPLHVVATTQIAETAQMAPRVLMARLDRVSARRAQQIKVFWMKRPASGWIGPFHVAATTQIARRARMAPIIRMAPRVRMARLDLVRARRARAAPHRSLSRVPCHTPVYRLSAPRTLNLLRAHTLV